MSSDTKPRINGDALRTYSLARWTLIPLHRYSDTQAKNGKTRKVGKAPLHFNWTVREYESAGVVADAIKNGRNVGVRLNSDQLVIDVDPRNGGVEGFDALCFDIGMDPSIFPCVVTGSGGFHYYMTKPKGIPITDTLKAYAGVEFKSRGRQVVAAGSIHPDTLKLYRFDTNAPALAMIPAVPRQLLNVIKRPQRDSSVTGGGQASQIQIAKALESLNPEDFREYNKWMKLAMACHHASNGDARSEFIEWSIQDPNYADDAERVGRHWDSFHVDRQEQSITVSTLNHFLRDAGAANAQLLVNNAADDFDDRKEFEGPPDEESEDAWLENGAAEEDDDESGSALQELSQKYCTVIDGDFRVMYLDEHPEMPGRRYWKSINTKAFCEHFSNRRIQRDTTGMGRNASSVVPLGRAWIEWPRRPSAVGITFDAAASPAENINARIIGGRLNLWTGWGCTPIENPDGCKRLLRMIRDDLCDGNDEVFAYTERWIAYKIQNPTLPCFTSLVFRGAKGAGKTTLGGEIMVPIFGSHGLVVSRRDQFVGQFSGHLASLCFIYADEAVWGGNKEDEGVLKQLITDRHRLYRAMYKEASYGVNRVGLMMGTNEDWAAPASFDERRFMVQDVSARHLVPQDAPADHPNRLYWDAIYHDLRNGGREAFFHHMRTLDLDGWAPNIGVPRTAALAAQIEEGMRGVDRWYYEMLTEAELPCYPGEDIPDWKESGQFVPYEALLRSCREWMRDNRQHATVTPRGLAKKLQPFGWARARKNAVKGLKAPLHAEAVKIFEKRVGRRIDG